MKREYRLFGTPMQDRVGACLEIFIYPLQDFPEMFRVPESPMYRLEELGINFDRNGYFS